MELHLPEILRHLSTRPMVLLTDHGIRMIPANNRDRRDMLAQFRPMLHTAGKFIFDSGQDVDRDTTDAIKQTSIAMMEDGRFHLPYTNTWIEDPFEENPSCRNYYLARESDGEIRVWLLTRHSPAPFDPPPQYFTFCLLPLIINLDGNFESHRIPVDHPPGSVGHDPRAFQGITIALAEVDYTIRKFIVTLGAGGIERAEISSERCAPSTRNPRTTAYPYTVIRIPSAVTSSLGTTTTGKRRRRHFVRGFLWGKNTRPREEQRWVPGYFRGDVDLGEVERMHYVVKD